MVSHVSPLSSLHCTTLHIAETCRRENYGASHCIALRTRGTILNMTHRTALHCTALHCTALYCTVLYCTVLYCTVLYCTVLYCTVLYCTVL
eukprot:COSAG06_NODE_491_length_15081_cov_9.093245_18_plen_90_part_01